MREHRLLRAQYRLREGSENAAFQGAGLYLSALRYFLFKSGPLTSAAFEVGGFIRTEPGSGRHDAQLGMGPMSIDTSTPGERNSGGWGKSVVSTGRSRGARAD